MVDHPLEDYFVWRCLKTIIAIHNYSIVILFTSNFIFLVKPNANMVFLQTSFPFFYFCIIRPIFSLIGVTYFTYGRFGSIINILVLLNVSFFSYFLLVQVMVDSPNVLSLHWPNFGSFFLLFCFLQLIMRSSLFLCHFSNQLGISHPNSNAKFFLL